MYFYVQRLPGDTSPVMFNSHCQNVILLDKIKQVLNLKPEMIIDVINVPSKECFMLHANPTCYANEVLTTGDTYQLCAVTIERIKIDEAEYKKKKKKLPENMVDGCEIKKTYGPIDEEHPEALDYTKLVPFTPGKKNRKK